LWSHPHQPCGPTSILCNEYRVCFLEKKWSGCVTDHPAHLVLRSCIQRAVPLLPLCAGLACNGTAFTFIHIQIPYKHITIIRRRPLKAVCSDPRLPDLTPICATFHSNCTRPFTVTHKMSVYFTAPITPLNLHSTSRHVTGNLIWAARKSISTARTFSFSISKARLNSSTSAECEDVSCCVSCSRYNI